jgi:hypothetical protein
MEMAVESMEQRLLSLEMAVESMEQRLRGQFPIPVGYRNRDFCPSKLVFDGGSAAELFVDGYWMT